MAIVGLLFGGVYLVYFSIITAVANIGVRTAATTAIEQEIESVRNLPYDSVGIVSGIPSGVIPATQSVSVGGYGFLLQTTIRNIDDPFDGTLGGIPNDTAPADYKLVSIQATCPLCVNSISVSITTTVAPKNLESATQNGSLFVYALNANGVGVQGAQVHLVNTSVTPSIDLSDTTNASGVLALVGVPTSTQGYSVVVTKPGYSTDQTYPLGGAGNPNPVKPNATVAAQTVTALSFSIDKLSSLSVSAVDDRCVAVPSDTFSMAGSKLIGTPNVLKFSTSSTMDASGTQTIQNLEWDTYTLNVSDISRELAGTIPLDPITINPNSTQTFKFILVPSADPALLATITDTATGNGITDAKVTLTEPGVSRILTTGQDTVSQTDWSGNHYSSQSGGVDTTTPGTMTLLANASSSYSTTTTEWLISSTIDLGGASSTLYSIAWNPTSEPVQTGPQSAIFQVAGNTDQATWNFIGPDGTSGSYFTSSSSSLPASLSGDRYIRYKVYMSTQDQHYTPSITKVSFTFSADCVPPAQVLFTSLPLGSYTLDVTAPNYFENSTTISITSGFQSSTLSLTHS